jgi:hypothetical protein
MRGSRLMCNSAAGLAARPRPVQEMERRSRTQFHSREANWSVADAATAVASGPAGCPRAVRSALRRASRCLCRSTVGAHAAVAYGDMALASCCRRRKSGDCAGSARRCSVEAGHPVSRPSVCGRDGRPIGPEFLRLSSQLIFGAPFGTSYGDDRPAGVEEVNLLRPDSGANRWECQRFQHPWCASAR